MPITKLRPSFTLTEDRLNELKAVVPEAFADGKINWEALREALGEHLEDAGPDAEHFGLFWPGKREARRLAAKPSKGALIPAPGEGVDEATTRNLFIEGDNLEVLKLLQKSYAGRVKMIYIDPPYNTGKDFIYSDNFTDPLDDYLRKTGQKGEEGELLTSNPKAGGRFHSNWLSMMYPRLLLARRLLREDGVIFISIDDHEVQNLRNVLDEIFGTENFVATCVWQKRYSRENRGIIGDVHEYIILYTKNQDEFSKVSNLLPPNEVSKAVYRNPNDDPKGPWRAIPMTAQGTRKNQMYAISTPTEVIHHPPKGRCWSVIESEFLKLKAAGRIYFGADGNGQPNVIRYLSEVEGFVPWTWWPHDEVGHTDEAKKEIHEFFGKENAFDTPKPTRLIKRVLQISTEKYVEELVLDFFAGSATTAHAVLNLNREDGGNRRFILVQLPEPTDNPKFPTIAEIGKERIRRVIKHMRADNSRAQTAIPLDGNRQSEIENPKSEDLGFKVFKLGRSSYKGWQDYEGDDVSQLETLFDAHESPLVKGWKPEHLLAETS